MGDKRQQNILIPELNIVANDLELRNLQRKMLAYFLPHLSNHYSQQAKPAHHKSESKINPER